MVSTHSTYPWQIGKAIHIGVDLALATTCLAGIKRNTGLSFKLDAVENETAREYTKKYLNMGDSMYDYAVATCGSSKYFERK